MILLINTSVGEKNFAAVSLSRKNFYLTSWKKIFHSQKLLPAIDRLFKKNNFQLKTIKLIAVLQGKESYTGLRMGISVANTLAWVLNIPVIRIKYDKPNININKKHISEILQKISKILVKRKNLAFNKILIPYYPSTK